MRQCKIKQTGEIVDATDFKRINELIEIFGNLSFDICSSPYSDIPVTFVRRKENESCHFRSQSGEKTIEDITEEKYYRGMTEWHKKWQNFMVENGWNIEVRHLIDGELHIADAEKICKEGKFIIEFEHSKLGTYDHIEIKRRTEAYKSEGYQVLWVFDKEDLPNSIFNSGINCIFADCGNEMAYYETMDNWEHKACKIFKNPKIENTKNWSLWHEILVKELYERDFAVKCIDELNEDVIDIKRTIISLKAKQTEIENDARNTRNTNESIKQEIKENSTLAKSIKNELKGLDMTKQQYEDKISALKSDWKILDAMKANGNNETKIEEIISKYKDNIRKLESEENDLMLSIEKLDQSFDEKKSKHKEEIDSYNSIIETLREKVKSLEQSIKQKESRLNYRVDDDVRAEKLKNLVEFLEKDLKGIARAHETASKELHEFCLIKENTQKECWALEKQLEELKRQVETHKNKLKP